jgi:hypothetical protein
VLGVRITDYVRSGVVPELIHCCGTVSVYTSVQTESVDVVC